MMEVRSEQNHSSQTFIGGKAFETRDFEDLNALEKFCLILTIFTIQGTEMKESRCTYFMIN